MFIICVAPRRDCILSTVIPPSLLNLAQHADRVRRRMVPCKEGVTIADFPGGRLSVRPGDDMGGGKWTRLLVPNAADRAWTWTEADAIGTTMVLTGTALDPSGARFDGRQMSVVGPGVHVRLTFTSTEEGGFTEKAEGSDDGKAWRTHHEDKYVRQAVIPATER